MKQYFLAFGVCLIAANASAEKYSCKTEDLDFKVQVNVRGDLEEDSAFVMILSDNSVQDGNKTIARLSGKGVNLGDGHKFSFRVSVPEEEQSGENILGTKMKMVERITFNYYSEDNIGDIRLKLSNGRTITAELPVCSVSL